MKLKSGFIAHEINGTQFLVPVGNESFNGTAKNNKAAAFILDCLKTDTTREKLADTVCARYDIPREAVEGDIAKILGILKGIDALEDQAETFSSRMEPETGECDVRMTVHAL